MSNLKLIKAKLEARLQTLSGRGKENANIIKKLQRQLKNIEGQLTNEIQN